MWSFIPALIVAVNHSQPALEWIYTCSWKHSTFIHTSHKAFSNSSSKNIHPSIRNQAHKRFKNKIIAEVFLCLLPEVATAASASRGGHWSGQSVIGAPHCIRYLCQGGFCLTRDKTWRSWKDVQKKFLVRLSSEHDGEGTWTPNPCLWPSRSKR